jgi:hypothetical protein
MENKKPIAGSRSEKPKQTIPSNIIYYPVRLTNGFELHTSELDQHYSPLPKGRRPFLGTWARFTGFENGIARAIINMPDENEHKLHFNITGRNEAADIEGSIVESQEITSSERTSSDETNSERTNSERTDSQRTNSQKPSSERINSERTDSQKPNSERTSSEETDSERTSSERPNSERTSSDETNSERTNSERTDSQRTNSERPSSEGIDSESTNSERTDSERTNSGRTDSERTGCKIADPTDFYFIGIHCNCGMPDGKLCKHAYYGLRSLMSYQPKMDFLFLYWPNLTTVVKGHSKFLNVKADPYSMTIEVNSSRWGTIFLPGKKFSAIQTETLQGQRPAALVPETQGNRLVAGYCLVYTFDHSERKLNHLPLLIPYSGITSRDNGKIVAFKKFIKTIDEEQGLNFTENQLKLNRLSREMYEVALGEKMLKEIDVEQREEAKAEMFRLWKEAVKLVFTEHFQHKYCTFGLSDVKQKIRKSQMQPCFMSVCSPIVSFTLKVKQDYFTLELALFKENKQLNPQFNKFNLFVTDGIFHYPSASLLDDTVIQNMKNNWNRITILKLHFRQFHQQSLQKLSECYTVMYYPEKNKNKKPYNFEDVLKDAGIV